MVEKIFFGKKNGALDFRLFFSFAEIKMVDFRWSITSECATNGKGINGKKMNTREKKKRKKS